MIDFDVWRGLLVDQSKVVATMPHGVRWYFWRVHLRNRREYVRARARQAARSRLEGWVEQTKRAYRERVAALNLN